MTESDRHHDERDRRPAGGGRSVGGRRVPSGASAPWTRSRHPLQIASTGARSSPAAFASEARSRPLRWGCRRWPTLTPRRRAGAGTRALPAQQAAEHPRRHGRPAAHAALVRRRARTAPPCRPTSRALARCRRQLHPPLHRLQRLHAGARDDAHRPAHPPDGLHDHRRQHARPGLPDLGDDAARARLRHLLVRQVAPDPRRSPLERAQRPAGARSATASPAAPTPRPTALPARAGASTPRSPSSSKHWYDAGRRRRAVVHDGVVREPARHRLVVALEQPLRVRGHRAEQGRARCRRTSRRPSSSRRGASRALQRSLQLTSAVSFGEVPFSGPGFEAAWLPFLDLYVKLQLEVDRHVGRVMTALARRPEVMANTIVIFTSDHGEYGGLARTARQGRGDVRGGDPRAADRQPTPAAALGAVPNTVRHQLTSSVDFAPLLLTLAAGSESWRYDPRYRISPTRANIARILRDPCAPGRQLRAARDRRGADRVRAAAPRGERAAARQGHRHAERQVRDLLELARWHARRPLARRAGRAL